MLNEILALAQQKAKAAVGRAIVPTAFSFVAATFFLFAVAALFCALFFWLEPLYGPPGAALIVAAAAFVIGLIATLPLLIGRRPPAASTPPPTLPQVMSLLTQSAPNMGPRQTALAAVLMAVALGLMARGSGGKK
jgi:hypothetical protein